MECLVCGKDWPYLSGQQIAVELKGHCMACETNYHFKDSFKWSREDWDCIRNVAMLRRGMHIAANFHSYLMSIGESHVPM